MAGRFQIEGREVIFGWLERTSDSNDRLIILDWLAALAHDPLDEAFRLPGVQAPIYLAVVPLRDPVTVKFLYAEQFRTLKVISVDPLP